MNSTLKVKLVRRGVRALLKSDEVKSYIETTYTGAVVPLT